MASIERALVSWQIKQWPQGKPKRYGVIRQSARRGGGYAPRRGAKRNAGADDGCVTNVHSARARLVSDHSGFTKEKDTYGLAVAARFLCLGRSEQPVFCFGSRIGPLNVKIASSSALRRMAISNILAANATPLLRAFALPCGSQHLARHPKVSQRELRFDLSRVLRESAIARLQISKLTLQHPKRMLHLRSYTQPFQGLCEANLVTWRAVQGRRVRRDV